MESKKQVGSSSSSFTADLFASKVSSSTQTKGIFSSTFSPPSMVGGRNSSSTKALESWPKQSLEAPLAEAATYNIPNKDRNSVYREERVEPCHLSSSLYYGGQDIYSLSSLNTQTSSTYPNFKKDGGEDASRGNWWQGGNRPRHHCVKESDFLKKLIDVEFALLLVFPSEEYGFYISLPRYSYTIRQKIMADMKYK